MTIEDRLLADLRRDLTDVPELLPPPDLADAVLRGVRRRRRAPVLAGAAVAAVLAVAVPVVTLGGGGGTPAATAPAPTPSPAVTVPLPPNPTRLPALGGGPRAILGFTVLGSGRTSLLDPRTGRFVEVPYEAAVLSPDARTVAVYDGSRTGLADRAALLRSGAQAIRWTGLTGGAPSWSPDGSALLATSVGKGTGPVTYTARRWDLADGRTTVTPVPPATQLVGTPAWAANSRDYLVLIPGPAAGPDHLELGTSGVLHPDGRIEPGTEGMVGVVTGAAAYSPSRRLVVTDVSGLMVGAPMPSMVRDARTYEHVGTLPAGAVPAWPKTPGWYDDDTVVRLDPRSVLLLVDAHTGATRRTVRLPGVPELSDVQLGASRGLPAGAPSF